MCYREENKMKLLLTCITGLCLLLPQSWAAKSFQTLQWNTKNGMRVIFYQAMEVPMLDISIAFAAGSAYDGNRYGLSALTTRLLDQGNKGLDSNTIAENLAEVGAQYEGTSNQDMVILSLRTLTEANALAKATSTYAAIISHPDFHIRAFNLEKNQQMMMIAALLDSPDEVAYQTFFQALYGNHPYGHPINGNRDTIAALSVQQVQQFYQRYFVSNNAVMVLVGAIDKSTAEQLAEHITKDLPKGTLAASIPKAQPVKDEMNIEVRFPSSQTILRLGQLGITHADPDYFPLLVGNYILGGGAMVSNLAEELREKRGLTYGVYSQFMPMPGIGPFLISFSTKASQANAAIKITRDTLAAFIKDGPDEPALVAAKQYLTGSFPLSLGSNKSIADMLLRRAFYHLPDNYLDTYTARINAVNIKDIKEAFRKRITASKLVQVSVGKS